MFCDHVLPLYGELQVQVITDSHDKSISFAVLRSFLSW